MSSLNEEYGWVSGFQTCGTSVHSNSWALLTSIFVWGEFNSERYSYDSHLTLAHFYGQMKLQAPIRLQRFSPHQWCKRRGKNELLKELLPLHSPRVVVGLVVVKRKMSWYKTATGIAKWRVSPSTTCKQTLWFPSHTRSLLWPDEAPSSNSLTKVLTTSVVQKKG